MKKNIAEKSIKWDLVDILLVVAVTLSLTPVLFWSLTGLIRIEFWHQNDLLVLNLIRACLLGTASLWVISWKYGVSYYRFGLRKINLEVGFKYGLIGGISLCLLVLGINNLTYQLMARVLGLSPPTQQVIQDLLTTETPLAFILHSLLIVVIAPVAEEIFFRGLIYPCLKAKLGITKGLLVNGVIFGAAHFNLWIFLPTFLGGVVLGWIYHRTRSLYSAILAHGIWNLIIVVLVYLIWRVGII